MDFAQFMDANPTIFHFVEGIERLLDSRGFLQLNERDLGSVKRGGKYYVSRNGSNLIAFVVGSDFIPGPDGYAIVASHIDANRLSLKPSSKKPVGELGYIRVGAAAYGDGGGEKWWDRDLGLGGRVILRSPKSGAVTSRLVRLPGVVGSIPRLAPHFGTLSTDKNREDREVPIIGTVDERTEASDEEKLSPLYGKHPVQLLRAVAKVLGVSASSILEWELELFSAEDAKIGGLEGEFLYCSRMDDRLCSFAAVKGLIEAQGRAPHSTQVVALYDDEEIGSETRTGAKNELLKGVMDLINSSLCGTNDELCQSMANSFIVSADVTHAGNPNYVDDAYMTGHIPKLNTGIAVKMLGRFASEPIGAAICHLISEKAGLTLQYFAPRNDTASGGTIGPMISASTGIRTVDVGIPIMAMHSIREVTGSRDVSLGIRWFRVFFAEADRLLSIIDL